MTTKSPRSLVPTLPRGNAAPDALRRVRLTASNFKQIHLNSRSHFEFASGRSFATQSVGEGIPTQSMGTRVNLASGLIGLPSRHPGPTPTLGQRISARIPPV